jgi:excisionase family DNA binding protein
MAGRKRKPRLHPAPALALSFDEAREAMSIGATMLRRLIASGELRTIKLGRRRLIPTSAIEELLASAGK